MVGFEEVSIGGCFTSSGCAAIAWHDGPSAIYHWQGWCWGKFRFTNFTMSSAPANGTSLLVRKPISMNLSAYALHILIIGKPLWTFEPFEPLGNGVFFHDLALIAGSSQNIGQRRTHFDGHFDARGGAPLALPSFWGESRNYSAENPGSGIIIALLKSTFGNRNTVVLQSQANNTKNISQYIIKILGLCQEGLKKEIFVPTDLNTGFCRVNLFHWFSNGEHSRRLCRCE